MTFTSQKVEALAGGALRVLGQLEIRGTKKAVALDVEPLSPAAKDPWGNIKRGTRATAKLNRKDFGLNWNSALELGGVLVGDEVEITLEVELNQK
jgi:polyisoprenoid-binding protein YceI